MTVKKVVKKREYRQSEYKLLLARIEEELSTAVSAYPPMASEHEAYAVILEELEEFWEEAKLKPAIRNPRLMKNELIQVAAMALRAIHDVLEPQLLAGGGTQPLERSK